MTYNIMARHKDHAPEAEVADTADGAGEAWELVYEYRVAYGDGWEVWPEKEDTE